MKETPEEKFFGCNVCSQAKLGNSQWSNFRIDNLRRFNCERHERSEIHLRSLAKNKNENFEPRHHVPLDLLVPILDGLRKGQSLNALAGDTAGRHKIKRILVAAGEVMKDDIARSLKRASTLALHQDGRGGALLVEFSACDRHLNLTRGILGIAEDAGTSSSEVAEATLKILKDACADDNDLFEHALGSIEVFNADAAPDEQRAGRIIQGQASSVKSLEVAPNLKLVMRDRTHAATRPGYCRWWW